MFSYSLLTDSKFCSKDRPAVKDHVQDNKLKNYTEEKILGIHERH